MDRYAVFVDAGYLWAAGIEATMSDREDFEQLSRANVAMDYSGMVATIKRYASGFAPGRELLRVYWYDAAPDRKPTREHQRIASIPETKLRLGHLTANGVQKNVDAMLLLDLTALARQNSIQTAVILGGDGDFVEGVITAQGFGVKVFLLGIEGPWENMSPELKMEADNFGHLGNSDLMRLFSTATDNGARPRWTRLELLGPDTSGNSTPREPEPKRTTLDPEEVYAAGRRFATRLKLTSSISELEGTLASKPTVPESLHYKLIRYTLESFEKPWGTYLSRELAQRMRDGFWDGLEAVVGSPRE